MRFHYYHIKNVPIMTGPAILSLGLGMDFVIHSLCSIHAVAGLARMVRLDPVHGKSIANRLCSRHGQLLAFLFDIFKGFHILVTLYQGSAYLFYWILQCDFE